MIQALLLMAGLGAFCGLVLSVASRIFYVYEDPRIEQVQDWLAGANCGGCGYAGCSSAAVAVVAGKAQANVCIVGGEEATHKIAEVINGLMPIIKKIISDIPNMANALFKDSANQPKNPEIVPIIGPKLLFIK